MCLSGHIIAIDADKTTGASCYSRRRHRLFHRCMKNRTANAGRDGNSHSVHGKNLQSCVLESESLIVLARQSVEGIAAGWQRPRLLPREGGGGT
jgi:hypothetical protein